MQSYRTGMWGKVRETAVATTKGTARDKKSRGQGENLRAAAAVLLMLTTIVPPGFAQQVGAPSNSTEKAASNLPSAPAPIMTEPVDLRTSSRDFSKPFGSWIGNPLKVYLPTRLDSASFVNSVRLNDLVKDGKIYLSLSDAIALALENNYDLAIARYDLDIADTDILRTRTGAAPLGVPSGLVQNTLTGSSSTAGAAGGGPGGTAGGAGGAGSGVNGLTLTTAGAGLAPENLDPTLGGTVSFDRARTAQTSSLSPASSSSTNQYNFTFTQGIVTGANFTFAFNNQYATSTNFFQTFSPQVTSLYKATLTQHLLQGAGIWMNKRFMYQALNDRRIANSAFREQILYTVNQVEGIYWGLVSAYEDVQAKQHALDQSQELLGENKKQLEVGSMAPLDVVNAQSTVATDQQNLISSQNTLQYQQQIIKQAIARNLNDQALFSAPVIPTDRVTLDPLPEESQPVEALVDEAFKQRPELEQAVLTLKNDAITLRGARNALLPTLDVEGYIQGQGIAGTVNPACANSPFYSFDPAGCLLPPTGYGTALTQDFNNNAPDKGVVFTLNIPLRNRLAQSVQERSVMEYRQAELHLEQLHTQIRMQVVNAMYALANDRAQVHTAEAGQDYAQQSYDAEQKKLHLGASTTANVLQQERNLATAQNNLIAAHAAYAKDRAGLYQTLATTLQQYGITLNEAASGQVGAAPVIPGVAPAKQGNEPATPLPTPATPAPAQ